MRMVERGLLGGFIGRSVAGGTMVRTIGLLVDLIVLLSCSAKLDLLMGFA
jgi:hypothetical protein